MNTLRTGLLLAALTGLFLAVGYILGGQQGMVIALIIAAATNLFAYWNADKIVLRTYGAQEVDAESAPELFAIVQQLASRARLPMPRVFIIDQAQPNAFATGRNPENASVAVTTGLLRLLDRQEIAGVLAHELAHVKNRDTLTMTVTATIAGALGMLANLGFFFGGGQRNDGNQGNAIVSLLMMILAPIAAMLVQMAISRTREYAADQDGAEICGRPLWLAAALRKLEEGASQIANPDAEANPATAHLFIVNPLHMRALDSLFSTHPRIENRVRELYKLAAARGQVSPWG